MTRLDTDERGLRQPNNPSADPILPARRFGQSPGMTGIRIIAIGQ